MVIAIQRLSVVILLSGIIGFEREARNRTAGLRTHILVGVGSCLLMLLQLYGLDEFIASHSESIVKIDPGRIPSYVINGIGFLGAGAIIVQGKASVKGLTTAASIWLTAGIGLSIGAGMYFEGIIATVIVILTLYALKKLKILVDGNEGAVVITVIAEQQNGSLAEIKSKLNEHKIDIKKTELEDDQELNVYSFLVNEYESKKHAATIEEIHQLPYVKKVTVQ